MNTKDKSIVISEFVIEALSYAKEHKLDIRNRGDVKKILTGLNIPYQKINLNDFIILLKDSENFLDILELERRRKKSKMIN